ncbi:MAG: tetratricopeptide repeat protein [Rudaea sp.]
MNTRNYTSILFCFFVVFLLAAGGVFAADKKEKQVNQYPNATRKEPRADVGSSGKDLNKAFDLLNSSKDDEAAPIIQKVLDNPRATPYAHALALQAQGQIAYNKQDNATAIKQFRAAYDADALPNNTQFSVLYEVAQLQVQDEKYQDSLNTLDEFFKVTGGVNKGEPYALQANDYYRLEKFQPAIDSIKKALSLTDKPGDNWYQILIASYSELEQYDQAADVLKQQLAKTPDDPKLLHLLAAIYVKGNHYDKAVGVLADERQKGLLSNEDDYKLAAQIYDQADKPKEGAAFLQEGFDKGVVAPSYPMYKLLGDSYALAQDDANAIKAYGKASAFAKDGDIDYMRGSLLLNNDRAKEAVEALKQAIAKGGLKHPGETYILLGDSYNQLDDTANARAAWQKAKAYPSAQKMADQRLAAGGHVNIKKKKS